MTKFNYKKATQLLNHLATLNGGTMNKMRALKLIWLCDRLHLRKYGRTITSDTYYALQFGPVASTTRDIVNGNSHLNQQIAEYSTGFISANGYNFKVETPTNLKVFSQTDLEVINQIWENYKQIDKFELAELSHKFPEWNKFESQLPKGSSSSFLMDINDFFKNTQDFSGLFIDNDEDLKVTKEIFEEYNKISSIC